MAQTDASQPLTQQDVNHNRAASINAHPYFQVRDQKIDERGSNKFKEIKKKRQGRGTSGTWTPPKSTGSQNGYACGATQGSNLTMPFFGTSLPTQAVPNMGDGHLSWICNVGSGDGYAPTWVPSTTVPPNRSHRPSPTTRPSTTRSGSLTGRSVTNPVVHPPTTSPTGTWANQQPALRPIAPCRAPSAMRAVPPHFVSTSLHKQAALCRPTKPTCRLAWRPPPAPCRHTGPVHLLCSRLAPGPLYSWVPNCSLKACNSDITKASMLAEFFFALAMLWWEGLRALKIDISS